VKLKLILPPTWLFMAAIAMLLLHFLIPVHELVPSPYQYTGGLPILAGLVLNIWSDQIFKRAGTAVKPDDQPTSLIVSGPYRVTRHPMYLGMSVSLVGLAVLLGRLTPWAIVSAFVILVAVRYMPAEEKAMEEAFGEEYRQYCRRVRRWL
jgi:protein-S-isoprenylcysteine O-methyltransferase Ste14